MNYTFFGKKHSIARRLLIAVILMSTAMTILTSAYQLNKNYQRYVDGINTRFTEIKTVHLKNLTNRLWTADIVALKSNLKEIAILPDIQYMEIKENGKIIASNGFKKKANIIIKTFPMTYLHKGKQVTIGALYVQATLDNAYNQVLTQILDILVSNGIKTFFLAGFILFIFNYLITRHLETMSEFTSSLDITKLDSHLSLDRKPSKQSKADELEILVQAFASMQENLSTSIKQLKDSERHYKELVETTTAIPWEIDLSSWRFTYVGPQAVRVLGYPVTDWYQENFWREHIHPDDTEFTLKFCHEATSSGSAHELEYRMISADGRTVWVKDDIKIVFINNKPAKLQGYMFDITEKKLTEIELEKHRTNLEKLITERTTELLASNKELEAFAYSVSHDLRAPLRGIDGFSQILIEDYGDNLDATALEYLERIRKAAQLMGKIITDLLLLSRVSRQELLITNVNLSTLANDAISRLLENSERKIQIKFESSLTVKADKNLVSIVFENLIGNAWKYSSRNNKAVIEFGQIERNNINFYFIKDNGIGFNMDFVDKIFQPFQRLHTTHEFEGTGIGLANVSRVIQRHGGEIFAESIEGEGASFYFRFS